MAEPKRETLSKMNWEADQAACMAVLDSLLRNLAR